MTFLQKLQKLPEDQKKVILWSVVIIIALITLSWWGTNFKNKLKNFNSENLNEQLQIPELKEEFENLPKFEMPEMPEVPELTDEELQQLEEAFQEEQE